MVIASDWGFDEFTMYDAKFDFGTFTLYGTQIESALEQFFTAFELSVVVGFHY
jgi:hypothetical protein